MIIELVMKQPITESHQTVSHHERIYCYQIIDTVLKLDSVCKDGYPFKPMAVAHPEQQSLAEEVSWFPGLLPGCAAH